MNLPHYLSRDTQTGTNAEEKIILPQINVEYQGLYLLTAHVNHVGAGTDEGTMNVKCNAYWRFMFKRASDSEYMTLGSREKASIPISCSWDDSSSFTSFIALDVDSYIPEFVNKTGHKTNAVYGSGFRCTLVKIYANGY